MSKEPLWDQDAFQPFAKGSFEHQAGIASIRARMAGYEYLNQSPFWNRLKRKKKICLPKLRRK